MQVTAIPFDTTDWATLETTEHKGQSGLAYWRTKFFGDIRVRMVEYTPGMSYQIADQAEAHRSYTELGAKLFVVD